MENDEEIPDSAIDPSRPLSEDHNHAFRSPFHQRVPVELEGIVALDILSVYEYAQRGNIKKMQNRAGQALMAAMDMSLHSCATEDEYSEARRRIWWMTVRAPQSVPVKHMGSGILTFSNPTVYLCSARRNCKQYGKDTLDRSVSLIHL